MRRRDLLSTSLAAGVATAFARRAAAQPSPAAAPSPATPAPAASGVAPSATSAGSTLIVPDGRVLTGRKVGGARVYHLVAEPIRHEVAPGLVIDTWGYNGGTPGPVIEATEGERVRVYVTNKLPEPTTVHWHGLVVPNGMDGVAGLTQPTIPPGETWRYEFVLPHAGTFMYHPHVDEMTQIALGMVGMIVVHPRRRPASERRVRDFVMMAHEWKIVPGARRPDPLAMSDFNQLAWNGKAFPATTPLTAATGDLVRIRIGNLGPMDGHPIHLHGHRFTVVETDGGQVPPGARWPETTVWVPVGAVRVIEFVADQPGDWPLHCHMTHHAMNQMGHDVPNWLDADVRGVDGRIRKLAPGYMTMGTTGMADMMQMDLPDNAISMRGGKGQYGAIDMGGMFTIVKVRDGLTGDADPGWFAHPAGTVPRAASAAELAGDGIDG